MRARIVIVGGGSYHWAPRLLCDFANTPSLTDADVVLHDLDADRLALMEDLGRQIARRRGIGLTTTAEPDRKQALAGATARHSQRFRCVHALDSTRQVCMLQSQNRQVCLPGDTF